MIATGIALMAPHPYARQTTVFVSTLPELYTAVNDPANAGTQVVVAAGTYSLDPDATNGGRLELQENMALIGQAGDREAVVIDASRLTIASYQGGGLTGVGLTGAVRVGRGRNTIEWLTVQNDLAGSAQIETDLAPTAAPTRIRVAHVIVRGGQRGIDARLVGADFDDRVVEVVVEDTISANNVRGMAQGMRILITGPSRATLRVTLRGNLFTGNQVGILAASQVQTTNNIIDIDSADDRFTDNRAGCWLIGGLQPTSSFNFLRFVSRGDEFTNNDRPKSQPTLPYTHNGGIVGIGGANRGVGNVASLEIHDGQFSGNGSADVRAFGYNEPGLPGGMNNRLELVRLSRIGAATVSIVPSDPADPGYTNVVTTPVQAWVGLKDRSVLSQGYGRAVDDPIRSDDVGTKFDLLGEVFVNAALVGSGQLSDANGGGSGFGNARLNAFDVIFREPVTFTPGDLLGFTLSARIAATSAQAAATARVWFNDASADSNFAAYFLHSGYLLGDAAGAGPTDTRDVSLSRRVAENTFKPFGTWSTRF